MIKVIVINPYYNETLVMTNIKKDRYINFLKNKSEGNEDYLEYINEKGNLSTFNPSNYANTEMIEILKDDYPPIPKSVGG